MSAIKLLAIGLFILSAGYQAAEVAAGAPKQRVAAVQPLSPSQSQATSPGAGQPQATSPGSSQTGAPNQRQAFHQTLAGGTPVIVPLDLGTPNVGGMVYSTGTDDIILTVLSPTGWGETKTVVVNGRALVLPNPNISAFADGIYILSPGPVRWVASNRQHGRRVNLGKLPPGEVVFAICTLPLSNVFRTGDGSRNPDQLPHAVVKTFRAGPIEVWFEDLPGDRSQSDRDFNDCVFQLSGGVSGSNEVADLLKTIKEEKGEAREAAIIALRKVNPKAAAIAGLELKP